MNPKVKYSQLALVTILLVTSCNSGSGFISRIDEVRHDAHYYAANKELVEVIGEVTLRVLLPEVTKHFPEFKYYTISDGFGDIIVTTQDYVPLSGQHVRIMGTIEQIFAAGFEGMNADEFAIHTNEVELLDDMEYCELKNDISDEPTDCWE